MGPILHNLLRYSLCNNITFVFRNYESMLVTHTIFHNEDVLHPLRERIVGTYFPSLDQVPRCYTHPPTRAHTHTHTHTHRDTYILHTCTWTHMNMNMQAHGHAYTWSHVIMCVAYLQEERSHQKLPADCGFCYQYSLFSCILFEAIG